MKIKNESQPELSPCFVPEKLRISLTLCAIFKNPNTQNGMRTFLKDN